MKRIFQKVWQFINSKFFSLTVIILLCLFLAGQCKRIVDQKQEINHHEQNISALNDSLKFERKKNGELLVSIDGYISTEKELKTLNKNLWDKLQEQEGKVLSLNSVIVQLIQDTAMLKKYVSTLESRIGALVKVDDKTYMAPWRLVYRYKGKDGKDTTNYDIYEGRTFVKLGSKDPFILIHDTTYMTFRKTQIGFTWGQKVEDKKLRVFIQSNYPGFTVAQMEGVLIDPSEYPSIFKSEKKHWFSGWSIGLGTTAGFNIATGKYGMVVGPTLQWSIYTW